MDAGCTCSWFNPSKNTKKKKYQTHISIDVIYLFSLYRKEKEEIYISLAGWFSALTISFYSCQEHLLSIIHKSVVTFSVSSSPCDPLRDAARLALSIYRLHISSPHLFILFAYIYIYIYICSAAVNIVEKEEETHSKILETISCAAAVGDRIFYLDTHTHTRNGCKKRGDMYIYGATSSMYMQLWVGLRKIENRKKEKKIQLFLGDVGRAVAYQSI